MTTTTPRSRAAALQDAVDSLHEIYDTVFDRAIELALSDALRAQAPADPDDPPPVIEPAVLRDCGDAAVRELVELMGDIHRIARHLS